MSPTDLLDLSPADIQRLSYPAFVGFVRETNRCPGGVRTLNQIANLTRLDHGHSVLEVGCTTGFTSLELASISRATFTGIDVSVEAVEEAQRRCQLYPPEIAGRVSFETLSLFDAPEHFQPFDLVVAGGATSFMQDKDSAIQAYRALVKPFGFLSLTNLYYHTPPPLALLSKVSETIGVDIEAKSDQQWLELFQQTGFETYAVETHELTPASLIRIERYVNAIMQQPHLRDLHPETCTVIRQRLRDMIDVFNENHAYLGYILVILRNNPLDVQPELFFATSDTRGRF